MNLGKINFKWIWNTIVQRPKNIGTAAKNLVHVLKSDEAPSQSTGTEETSKNENIKKSPSEIINGKEYSFYESGNRSAHVVILHIHGLVGDGANFTTQFEDPRFEHFYQIAPDWFTDIGDVRKYSLDEQKPIQEVIEQYFKDLLQQRPDRKIILHWVSLGWELAYRLAAKYPQYIHNVILSGASGIKADDWMKIDTQTVKKIDPNLDITDETKNLDPRKIFRDADILKAAIKAHFVDINMMPTDIPEKVQRLRDNRNLRLQLIKLARAWTYPDKESNTKDLEKLRDMGMPILLTRGEQDTIINMDGLEQFKEILQIKDKNVAVFPNANHMPNMDASYNEYNEILRNFMQRYKFKRR